MHRLTEQDQDSIARVLAVLDHEASECLGVVGYMWRDLAIEIREGVEEQPSAGVA